MSNRFDTQAASWDGETRRVKLASEIAAAILARVPVQPAWEALDFGCGTGLVTLALQPQLAHITGADASAGMLEELRRKVEGQALSSVDLVQVDPAHPLQLDRRFHLIASSMTLHHVEHPVPLLRTLREHLLPGGWIAVADLAEEDGSFHGPSTDVFHHGFRPETLEAHLGEAGFRDIEVKEAAQMEKGGRTYTVLLAIGTT